MSIAFLSYAQHDQAVAKRVASDLMERGITVWFDQTEILVGDSILERIREGIRSADYLIVLLSEHSRYSEWMQKEIRVAFENFGSQATRAIIPVVIDSTPVPDDLSNIRYVDLTKGYDQAIQEIVSRINRDCSTKGDLRKVVNTEDWARSIASERTIPRGAEFYVTGILGALGILAALIAAYPAFESMFSRIPKMYYDIRSESISYPPGTTDEQISGVLKALKDAGVAPTTLRLRTINKGHAPAEDIKIGFETEGNFLYMHSIPAQTSRVVWVDVATIIFDKGDKEAVLKLTNLVPEHMVIVDLGYEPPGSKTDAHVVVSGLSAEKVSDVDKITRWTLWKALELPIQIFIGGMLFSLVVGVGIAASKNPRLKTKLIELLEAVSPLFARILKILAS